MDSAISFGVLPRRAPSTMAIMRSRKASPGLLVTRTTSQSDSTRVPPVTEQKSPPDSRSTGADSPVIALSSTEATPSMTSPSAGMIVAALRPARCRHAAARTPERGYGRPPGADPSASSPAPPCEWSAAPPPAPCPALRRVPRRSSRTGPSATTTPRPSARTRGGRHPAPCRAPRRRPATVVKRLPMKTTNITGLRTCTRGSSLAKASRIPCRTMGRLSPSGRRHAWQSSQ